MWINNDGGEVTLVVSKQKDADGDKDRHEDKQGSSDQDGAWNVSWSNLDSFIVLLLLLLLKQMHIHFRPMFVEGKVKVIYMIPKDKQLT